MQRIALLLLLVVVVATPAGASEPGTAVVVDQPTGFADAATGAGNDSTLAYGGDVVSIDGRYVVFASLADGLSDDDDDTVRNVYRKDRVTGEVVLVSVEDDGTPGNGDSHAARVSDDGNRVVFTSTATNLAQPGPAGERVFVRDIGAGKTVLASRATGSGGAPATGAHGAISGNGKVVAFVTEAQLDGTYDQNGRSDVYARRLETGVTELVSRADGNTGMAGSGRSLEPSVNGDGLWVAFSSTSVLESADSNSTCDVYRRRLDTGISAGATDLISARDADGKAGSGCSSQPSISTSGSVVAYSSVASDLDKETPDANPSYDVHVLVNGSQVRLSSTFSGVTAGPSYWPDVADGAGLRVVYSTQLARSTQVVLRDLSDGSQEIVTPGAGQPLSRGWSGAPSLSGDAEVVVLQTNSPDLGDGIGGDHSDVVARDRKADRTAPASVPPSGPLAEDLDGIDTEPGSHALTPDGRYAVFSAGHDALGVEGNVWHVYRRDLRTGETLLVDRDPEGRPTKGGAWLPSVSADGNLVAFGTDDPLVGGDQNDESDVYVRDIAGGTTRLVSRTKDGDAGNEWSDVASISADGRRIAFESEASDLDASLSDGNQTSDVFVHDLAARETVLVSRAAAVGRYGSSSASIDADGTRVAFASNADNLDPDDTDDWTDVHVRDLEAGTVRLLSRRTDGTKLAGDSTDPRISGDGRRVVFESRAQLDPAADADNRSDIYVRDIGAGTTTLASRATGAEGSKADGTSSRPAISPDGSAVAFHSDAPNLGSPDGGVFVRRLGAATTEHAAAGGLVTLSGGGACVLFTASKDPVVRSSADFRRMVLRALTGACEVTTSAPAGPAGGGAGGGGAAAGGGGAASAAPVLRDLSVTRRRFRVGGAATARVAGVRRGTVVRFALDGAATVTLTVRRRKNGRWVRRGTLRRSAEAGANRVRFSGRIGRRALRPGRHSLVAVARDAQGRASAPRRAGFRVVR